ncbi:MAG: sensor histidine kinase [Methylotenera sp.]|nr:sensor histidine kinase [Methylotenera sp.]MDP1754142.1 sensor histidine kinase [Methylotenera sp.]MDP1959040.1 sensor histidine kinase [Methylotenera sp.]MDP3303588.1 sensor histidine kinase [Methylotenera sp.]MDP3942927.1 sensor histidine kinase [Methylotenera sp.]
MSLRFRLNLLVTFLSLAFILVVGTILVNDTRVSIRERVEAASRVTVQLLDTVIVSSAINPEMGPTHIVLQQFLTSLGYVRSSHIALYDYQGHELYHSPDSTFKSEVYPPDWFVKLVQPKVEIVERKIRYGTLVVSSSAAGSIREAWSGFSQLMWVGLAFFLLLNTMVYLLLSHSLRPVNQILAAINRIEQGDLTTRLPTFTLPEFERIGHSLNRMAESLTAERQLEENRQLTHLIQKHIEEERASLARELHDELGQYVTAIKTFAVAIANKAKTNSASAGMTEIASSAQIIVSAANQIYDGMHNIVRQLRPASLDNLGLAETLKDLVSSHQVQHPEIQIQLHLSGNLERIGETVSINLYRIVQESLNNALKYAKATTIAVSLIKTPDGELQLAIKDNGVGMDIETVDQDKHFGLLGMRERVQALYGSFSIEAAPNQGTVISIHIPKRIAS